MTFIIVLLIVGFIVGAVARFLVPGRDPMGCLGTILLGVAGSFVGGFVENLIEYHTLSVHQFHTVGLLGAVILLLLLRLTGLERGRYGRR